MEINLNLKNVKKISYELYDGSKVELNDKSYIEEYCCNKSVPKNKIYNDKSVLDEYKDSLYEDLTNKVKEKFQPIINKSDELVKNHAIKIHETNKQHAKDYYQTIM